MNHSAAAAYTSMAQPFGVSAHTPPHMPTVRQDSMSKLMYFGDNLYNKSRQNTRNMTECNLFFNRVIISKLQNSIQSKKQRVYYVC